MKQTYEIGDECWIYIGAKQGGHHALTKGKVAHKFFTPFRALEQYAVLIDDPDYMTLELRDVFLMSPSQDELPPFAQNNPPTVQEMRPR